MFTESGYIMCPSERIGSAEWTIAHRDTQPVRFKVYYALPLFS